MNPENSPVVRLTPEAVAHLRRFLDTRPDAPGVRFGVKKMGCSGWGYDIDLAVGAREDDCRIEQDGIAVLIDQKSLLLVAGTEIDFVREGLNQQFVFRNPNAVGECGCGESFTTIDPDEARV